MCLIVRDIAFACVKGIDEVEKANRYRRLTHYIRFVYHFPSCRRIPNDIIGQLIYNSTRRERKNQLDLFAVLFKR